MLNDRPSSEDSTNKGDIQGLPVVLCHLQLGMDSHGAAEGNMQKYDPLVMTNMAMGNGP